MPLEHIYQFAWFSSSRSLFVHKKIMKWNSILEIISLQNASWAKNKCKYMGHSWDVTNKEGTSQNLQDPVGDDAFIGLNL